MIVYRYLALDGLPSDLVGGDMVTTECKYFSVGHVCTANIQLNTIFFLQKKNTTVMQCEVPNVRDQSDKLQIVTVKL